MKSSRCQKDGDLVYLKRYEVVYIGKKLHIFVLKKTPLWNLNYFGNKFFIFFWVFLTMKLKTINDLLFIIFPFYNMVPSSKFDVSLFGNQHQLRFFSWSPYSFVPFLKFPFIGNVLMYRILESNSIVSWNYQKSFLCNKYLSLIAEGVQDIRNLILLQWLMSSLW